MEISKERFSQVMLDEFTGCCNEYDEEVKTEDDIKAFIQAEIDGSIYAEQKNKESIFFDTRRYFWKYENKEFKKIGWCPTIWVDDKSAT